MSIYTQSNEELIDNAATAAQHRPLLDNAVVREAVKLNCCKPLRERITELEETNRQLCYELDEAQRALERKEDE